MLSLEIQAVEHLYDPDAKFYDHSTFQAASSGMFMRTGWWQKKADARALDLVNLRRNNMGT